MKKQRVVLVFCCILSLTLLFSGCGGGENSDPTNSTGEAVDLVEQLAGSWYRDGKTSTNREGGQSPAFTLYSDGTCEIATEYGEGTWAIVNDNQLKLTNFYGEAETVTIASIEDGCLTLEDGTVFLNYLEGSDAATDSESNDSLDGHRTNVVLTDARAFSEEIAWVRYDDGNGENQIGWLHTDGSVSTPALLEGITRFGSDFSGGYTYINIKNADPTYFKVLNQNGEISAQSPDDGYSYQILAGGDGIYLVKQSIRSMTENEDRYGFISADGTWIYECTPCEAGGTHPLSLDVVPSDFNQDNISYSYLGDGVFRAVYHNGYEGSLYFRSYGVALYNAYTGKSFVLDSNTSVFTDSSANTVGQFSDGLILVNKDGYALMSSDFELISIPVESFGSVDYSESKILTWPNRNYPDRKLYSIDGTLIADLTEFTFESEEGFYEFNNGYAALCISGADGGSYLGIIDSTGAFTFEPIKISRYINRDTVGILSDGVVACVIPDVGKAIVSINGDITPFSASNDCGDIAFYDGYAWDSGNEQFIKIDGSILVPFLTEDK